MTQQAAWAAQIRRQIDYEWQRTELPSDFPSLPPIPVGRYTDPGFFALEREHVWQKSWLLAGRDEDFAGPGSFRTFDRTGSPLLLVRGGDDVLRGFFNTCQHRGAPVVRDACGTAKRLRCQYHSWTYDLDGTLIQVPDRRDFGELDESQRALKPVRCEVYDGWVFVNEDLGARPLREWLGPIASEWSPLRGAELRGHGTRCERVPANWKIVSDAFLETYHLKTIHPQTVSKLLDHRGAAMGLFPHGHSRMVTPKWPEAIAQQRENPIPLPLIPDLDQVFSDTNPAYSVFPNLITPLDTIGFPFILFWPIDAGTTDVEWTFYGPRSETPEQEKIWEMFIQVFDGVMNEDFMNLAPMQRSISSGALESIPLSYQERRIYHLHEEIDRIIGPAKIPETLRVPPRLEPFWETDPG
ncbi:MAG: aromatic ring-hydroxylating dioxygenase subunit alpha [Myxococcota bacterium]|nr:aromatic ring-hydroxylating dioxygenase subunit alpha [Myxococcota bacterium]